MATKKTVAPPRRAVAADAKSDAKASMRADEVKSTPDDKAATTPTPGIDPRVTAEAQAQNEAAHRVIAAAPTPTVESAATANDHPGIGGDTPTDADHLPRRRAKVKKVETVSVTVPKTFTITDDNGEKFTYHQGIQDIDREHAEHWYAAAHGVEINE